MNSLKSSVRRLVRTPVFSLVFISCLSVACTSIVIIGIIAKVTVFAHAPYSAPDQLVAIYSAGKKVANPSGETSEAVFAAAEDAAFATHIGAYSDTVVTLSGLGSPEEINVAVATKDLLPALMVHPIWGGVPSPDDESQVLISYELWKRKYGLQQSVLGNSIQLNRVTFHIAGVLPQGFALPTGAVEVLYGFKIPSPPHPDSAYLHIVARLKTGMTAQQAKSSLVSAITVRAHQDGWDRVLQFSGYPTIESLSSYMTKDLREFLYLGTTISVCLCLLIMLNLGGLLLGYLENRRYEYGIRQILGNRRSILIRELAAEFAPLMLASVLLASIAVNAVLHRGFPAAWKIAIPPTAGSTVWSEVLLVGIIGLFWVGAIAVSYLRLRPSNLDCSVLVHRTASVNSTPQLVLLAIEVALAVPLLQSALALDRSVVLLKSVNVGFDPGNVQSFSLSLPFGPYSTPQLASNFWTKLVNDLSQKRGIDRVGVVSTLPLTRPPAALMKPIEIDGARADLGGAPRALVSMASSGYFSTMHIPLVEGRFFQDGDGTNGDTPVLISKHLSQVLFGTGDPISRRIRPARSAIWSTIIGIVGDVPGESLRSSYADTIYFPVATGISSTYSTPFLPLNLSVVMRSPLPADLVLDTARGSLRQVDDGIPVVSDTGLVDVVANAAHQAEILAGMASIASCIMLGLTAMALYALIARATATRMREIGIRMALGAPKNQVIRIFLYGSLRAVLIGVSIGIVISVATGPAIRASLYRVSPTSFSLVMVTSGTIILFSFVAAYLPVRKAVQQDALTLLHDE